MEIKKINSIDNNNTGNDIEAGENAEDFIGDIIISAMTDMGWLAAENDDDVAAAESAAAAGNSAGAAGAGCDMHRRQHVRFAAQASGSVAGSAGSAAAANRVMQADVANAAFNRRQHNWPMHDNHADAPNTRSLASTDSCCENSAQADPSDFSDDCPIELPAELLPDNFDKLMSTLPTEPLAITSLSGESPFDNNSVDCLARAARGSKQLTPDVLARMAADRQKARQQKSKTAQIGD